MMWGKTLLVICLSVPLISARESANADKLSNYFDITKLSNNVLEDARLDVPDLVKKYGYPLEKHFAITDDGYILGMHRIPHGRDKNNVTVRNKPVVFLMHGLMCSSADWVIMGPGSGFAYILAEEGYDVWMGNARGNYYSRHSLDLDPDKRKFWEFSWDEIGNYDLPSMIDFALGYTGQSRLHYIGHSQGTTAFFVMGSLRPQYNEKIIAMHALAPVAYMAHNRNPLLRVLAPFSNQIEIVARYLGYGEFLPNSKIMQWAGQVLCMEEAVTQILCTNILFLWGGWAEDQMNKTMLPVIFGHAPAGSSVRQFAHYGQGIYSERFRRYDHLLLNWIVYGCIFPPKYDLRKVTTPVYLHYAERDLLANVKDVKTLSEQLGRLAGKYRIPEIKFSHLDFTYGINAKELVYDPVMKLIKEDINRLNNKVN